MQVQNRFFLFNLPIQAMNGILQHSVEKEVYRAFEDSKKFIVKLPIGDTNDYPNFSAGEEHNHNEIIDVIKELELANNNEIY